MVVLVFIRKVGNMAIKIQLDTIMATKKVSLNELSNEVGISNVNLSRLKNDKGREIRFSTLDAMCKILECQPGDIIKYISDETSKDN